MFPSTATHTLSRLSRPQNLKHACTKTAKRATTAVKLNPSVVTITIKNFSSSSAATTLASQNNGNQQQLNVNFDNKGFERVRSSPLNNHPFMKEYVLMGFEPDPDHDRAIDGLIGVYDQLTNSNSSTSSKGLYIYGGCGRGKTALSDVLYRSLPVESGIVRVHWHEFAAKAWRKMKEVDGKMREEEINQQPKEVKKSSSSGGGWLGVFRNVFGGGNKGAFNSSSNTSNSAGVDNNDRQKRLFKRLSHELFENDDTITFKGTDKNEIQAVFLDDLMITHISEAVLAQSLFEALWERDIILVITSNYGPDSLYAKGNLNRDRFSSWVVGNLPGKCEVISMGMENRKDYREVYSATVKRFLSPINEENRERFEEIFKEKCKDSELPRDCNGEVEYNPADPNYGSIKEFEGCDGEVHYLTNFSFPVNAVSGRKLVVPRCTTDRETAAMFTFKELFAQNLGREDYTALLDQFKSVFISDVPKMKTTVDKYEFTRFATFVDLAYYRRTSEDTDSTDTSYEVVTPDSDVNSQFLDVADNEVYLLAETAVAEMYEGGDSEGELEDSKWAWRRTRSHLWEMGNEGWARKE